MRLSDISEIFPFHIGTKQKHLKFLRHTPEQQMAWFIRAFAWEVGEWKNSQVSAIITRLLAVLGSLSQKLHVSILSQYGKGKFLKSQKNSRLGKPVSLYGVPSLFLVWKTKLKSETYAYSLIPCIPCFSILLIQSIPSIHQSLLLLSSPLSRSFSSLIL